MNIDGQHDDLTRSIELLAPGTRVGHFEIVRRLGAGGMGEVFLARDGRLERDVALKFLGGQLAADAEYRRRFTREAQSAARIDHPHVVRIYEVAEHAGRPFFAMQHVEGETLAEHAAGRLLSVEAIIALGAQTCDGLQAAHARGVVHRDLKPGNVMIDRTRRVCILDFGLAALVEPDAPDDRGRAFDRITGSSIALGTVPYMAPEQLEGRASGHLVDIFALGVILYELACGARPFVGSSAAAIASSILRDAPLPITARRPDLPYDLARIIGRCLQKNSERRFQTARDVQNELEDLREALAAGTAAPVAESSARQSLAAPSEVEFALTADLVRQLQGRDPRMIGDKMTYLDNGVESDSLVVVLPGTGQDQRMFPDLLEKLPIHGVTLTLYGFGPKARFRPALSLGDHSILVRALLGHLRRRNKPRRLLLIGFSSGADHALQLITAEGETPFEVDGLLLLGCNIDLSTCFVTRVFSELEADAPTEMLEKIKMLGGGARSLGEWLAIHDYLVQVFRKLGTDIAAMKRYAADIVAPFAAGGSAQFIAWYRFAAEHVRCVRFVFAREESAPLDRVLLSHLESGVLGNRYSEETIVREDIPHIDLRQPALILRHVAEIIKKLAGEDPGQS